MVVIPLIITLFFALVMFVVTVVVLEFSSRNFDLSLLHVSFLYISVTMMVLLLYSLSMDKIME